MDPQLSATSKGIINLASGVTVRTVSIDREFSVTFRYNDEHKNIHLHFMAAKVGEHGEADLSRWLVVFFTRWIGRSVRSSQQIGGLPDQSAMRSRKI